MTFLLSFSPPRLEYICRKHGGIVWHGGASGHLHAYLPVTRSHGKKALLSASRKIEVWWRHVARPERPASYGTSCSVPCTYGVTWMSRFLFCCFLVVSLGLEHSKPTRSMYKTNAGNGHDARGSLGLRLMGKNIYIRDAKLPLWQPLTSTACRPTQRKKITERSSGWLWFSLVWICRW